MRYLAALILISVPAISQAQFASGPAVAVDGDMLEVGGSQVRLFGIDAPEIHQTCERAGQAWSCGRDAATLLSELLQRGGATCELRGVDALGQSLAVCMVGRIDLSDAMVRAGLAVSVPELTDAYVAGAETAQMHSLGIWAGTFEQPKDFRASNPPAAPREEPRALVAERLSSRAAAQGVFYRNCDAVRAAGAAPLHRGQPGYRPQMDGDSDGIACEPIRRR